MTPLWEHQKRAVEKGLASPHLGIFHQIGTGKSRSVIELLRHRSADEGRLLRTLILSPKITLSNWKREIEKYSKIHPRDVVILDGNGRKRVATIKKECTEGTQLLKSKVLITNYESVEMPALLEALNDWAPELMILDEAHRVRSPEGKRAKRVLQLGLPVRFKYALTGSPILNSAMDIFNIFKFLDNGETFGTNFWRFRSIWFEDENAQWASRPGYFPKYVARPETYKELNKLIYAKADRAVKADCLDLPPFVRKEIYVDLGVDQKRLYEEMKRDYVAFILSKEKEPRAVVAQMAVTKALRLQQIVTGYAKDEMGEVHKIKDNPRLEVLRELLSDMAPHHKVIVWSVFHENYTDIAEVCKKLGLEYGELHGKINNADREKYIKAFNESETCRVLIANQSAAGIGINLVSSDISIYYSKNFSQEADLQSEGRNYRGGSEIHQKVTRIDLVAKGTIDELISEVLACKTDIAQKILEWRP